MGDQVRQTVAVIGGGSWATAIVKMLSEQDIKINWWLRSVSDIKHITKYHRNPSYLSTAKINLNKVNPTNDLKASVRDASILIIVIPAAFVAEAISDLSQTDLKGKRIVSSIKGMVPDENLLITDYLKKHFRVEHHDLAVISGPCHAEEVAMERQSYLTVASEDEDFALQLADLLRCHYISVTTNTDIYGVEYSAVIKNIVSIACGIAHGLNFGDNFQAVLVSNALSEIKDFLDAVSQKERDINASAYLGDLLVTAYSQFSRNRTFGNMIGRGYSVKSAQMEMEMIAEGYYAAKSIHEIKQEFEIELPIIETVYHILYEKISPIIEFQILKDKLK
ncbi:NAD(P)H-dependent glycerol-3-phosphate dehydrogenase [Flexithrix dorotheae]|uniref:NAD(P)H-dependent glycerol-3-phosphate dehydrogenase n=1 Tax=Flexithrix dorotheae TaxID=70993 RepID=UPI0003799781|nr:NAD(P)H-dependent glycerol-3-phosphate dehydrogenase [Flexithrix dorotheae]